MAIKDFKKIEGTKGYFVDDKDRNIFEREISKGYFGMNTGDLIEFIIYDSNDNQLPQEANGGKLVRYIEYNDNTEKKYFGKVQKNKLTIKSNDSDSFFIDAEKLIKEAGYSQGIFKTQVSLVNRRLGSEDRVNDKVWIHEIAPSRTEIRLLPTIENETGKPNSDLEARYECFIKCEMFAGDVYPFIDDFVNQIQVEDIIKNMFTLKGKVESGKKYIDLIKKEFKIDNFDIWVTKVREKIIESANHFKNNREYNIISNKYGKPLSGEPKLCYKENEISETIVSIVENVIQFYLPKRELKEDSILSFEQQKTIDKVDELLKTVTSNEEFETSIPETINAKIVGCKDPNAGNYNPDADIHDQTMCIYVKPDPDPKPIDTPTNPIQTPVIEPVNPRPFTVPVNSGVGGRFSFRPEQYEVFGTDEYGMVNSEPIIINNERFE